MFRFVSLRSPELSKKENQKTRFIFLPENNSEDKDAKSSFMKTVRKMPRTANKRNVLRGFAQTYNSFTQDSEVVELCGKEFMEVSAWIATKRTNTPVEELLEKIKDLTILDEETESKLWDQLFYQVITPTSIYVKECIMQALVLQNILKQKEAINDINDFTAKIPDLVNAKIVIPSELFEKEDTPGGGNNSNKQPSISKKLINAQKITESQAKIEEYESFITDIEALAKKEEEKYQEEYTQAYNEAYKEYQELIDSLLEQENIANPPKENPENEGEDEGTEDPENEEGEDNGTGSNIKLPEFSFDYPKLNVIENITPKIPEEHKELFTELSAKYSTVNEMVSLLKEKISEETQIIFKFTETSKPTDIFGSSISKFTKNRLLPFSVKGLAKGLKNSILFDIALQVEIPDSTFEVSDFSYKIVTEDTDGKEFQNNDFNAYFNQGVLTIRKLFTSDFQDLKNSTTKKIFTGTLSFINGKEYAFEIELPDLKKSYYGNLTNTQEEESGNESEEVPPLSFGVTQLGIADYKKVVSEVSGYQAGEVSHIENIMAREFKEKSTKKFHQTQVSTTETSETETEKISDSTTTERFEMQSEISKLIQEHMDSSVNTNMRGKAGTYSFDLSTGFATGRSKEESNRQAVNQAKELTQRAMERIVSKYKKEVTTKITDEFTEETKHGFDNRKGDKHVSGVYRFINAIYRNQIYNYGKRLMYEFVIPQPSKLHRLAISEAKTGANTLKKPLDPRECGLDDFSKLNENNYKYWAAAYGAEVKALPEKTINISHSFSKENVDYWAESADGKVDIPENYKAISFSGHLTTSKTGKHSDGNGQNNSYISVGDILFDINTAQNNGSPYRKHYLNGNGLNVIKQLTYSMNSWRVKVYALSLKVICQLTDNAITKWQIETFNSVMESYFTQLEDYNSKLEEIKTENEKRFETNPNHYREIENTTLRKNCISYLLPQNAAEIGRDMGNDNLFTGEGLTDFKINQSNELEQYGSFVKFIEQGFEWDLMSYNFYPFYWGSREDWAELYQYESNDALFKSFMQSGLARVIVTVKPGFEDAVMHYMATGQIWNGGEIPVLNDPLYLSIVDELKEQEYVVEETWETIVPTSLTALQSGGVAIEASGLPTLYKDKGMGSVIGNDYSLGTIEDKKPEAEAAKGQ